MGKSSNRSGAPDAGKTQNQSARTSSSASLPGDDWLSGATIEAPAIEVDTGTERDSFDGADGKLPAEPEPVSTPAAEGTFTAYGLQKGPGGYMTVRYTITLANPAEGDLRVVKVMTENVKDPEPYRAVAYAYAEMALRDEYMKGRG